jgi:predicted amidohydrolase
MKEKRLRVAAIQMRFAPTIEGNLATMEGLLVKAHRQHADVALFPECATTGYHYDFASLTPKETKRALEGVSMLAAKFQMNLLVGAPVYQRGRLYNALVVFDREGRIGHCYAKCHLTEMDRRYFTPGNAIALFLIDGHWATAIICHERRYPEMVRLAVMAGAQILFHPNAGLDSLAVSRAKRHGNDGMVVRAFENAIHYVFANSFGPQGGGKWSAGGSKIVVADGGVLAHAGHEEEAVLVRELDMEAATRKYALEGMAQPRFLSTAWKRMVREVKKSAQSGQFKLSRGAIKKGLLGGLRQQSLQPKGAVKATDDEGDAYAKEERP